MGGAAGTEGEIARDPGAGGDRAAEFRAAGPGCQSLGAARPCPERRRQRRYRATPQAARNLWRRMCARPMRPRPRRAARRRPDRRPSRPIARAGGFRDESADRSARGADKRAHASLVQAAAAARAAQGRNARSARSGYGRVPPAAAGEGAHGAAIARARAGPAARARPLKALRRRALGVEPTSAPIRSGWRSLRLSPTRARRRRAISSAPSNRWPRSCAPSRTSPRKAPRSRIS